MVQTTQHEFSPFAEQRCSAVSGVLKHIVNLTGFVKASQALALYRSEIRGIYG
jgi:hypothetical protein